MPSPPTPLPILGEGRLSGPIGVFDSGVGGLTVVGALLNRFPNDRVIYVADQAHVPYGGRPLDEVRGFACGISSFLVTQECRSVVMACNISSAVALDSVREALAPIPVFAMIEAAAQRAAESGKRIGVLATQGTVTSGAYTRQIKRFAPDAFVKEVACPEFVPLVEADKTQSPEARRAARQYLFELHDADCELIILGCTHYPYLEPVLQEFAESLWGRPIPFLDPALELVNAAAPQLAGDVAGNVQHRLLTTGDISGFVSQIPRFLPNVPCVCGSARWRNNTLTISGR